MKFTSFAQNFEDIMLWRALNGIKNGFYIDVGAQDPIVDSVSKGFYENGWRGVHIEPTKQYSALLKIERPEEEVVQAAVSSEKGEIKFYEFLDTGLSTADPIIARSHLNLGFTAIETVVPTITLDEILNRFSTKDVHWLKIDVEGFEYSVIESWNESEVRPWILLIESTLPLTETSSHAQWEPMILDKGYVFAYFDGLNRYYVNINHEYLLRSFKAPPNVFDEFSLSGTASNSLCANVQAVAQQHATRAAHAERHINYLSSLAKQTEIRASAAEASLESLKIQLSESKREINELKASSSWRLTMPLRNIATAIRSIGSKPIKTRIEPIKFHSQLYINRRPRLKALIAIVAPLLQRSIAANHWQKPPNTSGKYVTSRNANPSQCFRENRHARHIQSIVLSIKNQQDGIK